MFYYVDGEQVAESDCDNPSALSTKSLKIGWDDRFGSWFFNGMADEVRIYDRALSEAEVNQNRDALTTAVDSSDKLSSCWGAIKSIY